MLAIARRLLTISCLLLGLTTESAAEAQVAVADEVHHFRFEVPLGYKTAAEPLSSFPNTLYEYESNRGSSVTRLIFSLGERTIEPGPLDREDLRKGAAETMINPQVDLVPYKWKDFTLECMRVHGRPKNAPKGAEYTNLSVMVPLKPRFLAVVVLSTRAEESWSDDTMQSVLASLEGETNWTEGGRSSEAAVAEAHIDTAGKRLGYFALIACIALPLMWSLFRFAKR